MRYIVGVDLGGTNIVVGTVAPIVIALPLALVLASLARGRLFYQTAYFMPHILSGVVIAMIAEAFKAGARLQDDVEGLV